MIKCLILNKYQLSLLLSVSVLLAPGYLESKEQCFTNFSETLCGDFTYANAVIVKSALDKAQLQLKLKKPLTQIAFLGEHYLYLAASSDPFQDATDLAKLKYIQYAQPDIIQKREHSERSPKIGHDIETFSRHVEDGKGVRVAIIDDGFDLNHQDLLGVDILFTYDVDRKRLNLSENTSYSNHGSYHGTRVAGVIFAQHNNGGINGIAPAASLIAIRQSLNRTSDTVLAFTVAAKAGADIINCSWNSPLLMQPVYDVMSYLADKGRDGKGIAIVVAAGNSGEVLAPLTVEAAIPVVITVGTDKPYSNSGSLVDVIAPTGFRTTTSSNGYQIFSGTSASAAYVSGKIARIIQRHPQLDLFEIKKVLKK